MKPLFCLALGGMGLVPCFGQASLELLATQRAADQWRSEYRLVDMHQHIDGQEARLTRAARIMDAAGLGIGVNLSGGTTTAKDGQPSAFQRTKALADKLHPGRFVHYMNLDYADWEKPDFTAQAVRQVEEGHRLGAAGLKEFKRLGLFLRDSAQDLYKIDDPRLEPVWAKCGELGLPVSVHVADPRAFWQPYEAKNERWTELKDHPNWWFGDPKKFPAREVLLAALERVIARHRQTTFVCVHFANNAEDLGWVDEQLSKHPNMMADVAARIPELGRHDPERLRQVFLKHQDRLVFGTDFQVYDKLTLGSGGQGPPPTEADAQSFYAKHWRWFETRDRDFAHMTPIQGDWTISAIGLPISALRKIYFDNARRLLARALPAPSIQALRVENDFEIDGTLNELAWRQARRAPIEQDSRSAAAWPDLASSVRVLWSDQFLYLGYECPYTELSSFSPADPAKERVGLWEKDVVEAFIGQDWNNIGRYTEYEVAPNNEWVDLTVDLQADTKDFAWNSGFEHAVKVDAATKIWTSEWRIPLKSLAAEVPKPGTRWRANFYRGDTAHQAGLAWNPTLTSTFHTPARFGVLEF